jgi:hypothetical protein
MVICLSPFISLFALHFTQYPAVANRRKFCALGYKNSSVRAHFALLEHKTSPNLANSGVKLKNAVLMERKQADFERKFKQKLRPAASYLLKIVAASCASKSRNPHPSRREIRGACVGSVGATVGQ